jgi:hypothetical protein
MGDILRFEMNVPVKVALKDDCLGKTFEGRYGNRVMYGLADDRVMYVAPIVARRISELGIQPGEVFLVCKQVKKQGQRRLIDWQVQRLQETAPETQLERELRESIALAEANKAKEPSKADEESYSQPLRSTPVEPTPLHAAPRAEPVSNSFRNGAASGSGANGNGQPHSATKLEHALKTAISAAYNAERYGAELGYVVRFDADAIKSMAITVLINMSGEGRR